LDIVVYLVFLAVATALGARGATWYVGLGLAAVTVPFWFAARWQLGASFSATAQARKLVTSGLYSKFRHPVYVFGGVAWLGALMVLLGWRAVIICLIVAAIELVRARREERVLAEAFGAEYEEYRRSTWL
jgi:protein-S-isoprenylcysteine O-methyltransferase Ste14